LHERVGALVDELALVAVQPVQRGLLGGLEFRVWGFGFGVEGLGCGV